MLDRLLKNTIRTPQRFVVGLFRLVQPMYRVQRAANRYTKQTLSKQQVERMSAIPGTSSARECRLLYYLASTSPADGCMVKIGAFKGKSTAWLAEAARRKDQRLVSIDPHVLEAGSLDVFRETVKAFDIESVATLHRAYSHDIAKDWDQPIAFLWIDGDHEYEAVVKDIEDYTPFVQPGAFVVFDDVDSPLFPGVERAVTETIGQDDRFRHVGRIKMFDIFECRST